MRSREKHDGLPHRPYERYGARIYSIGYKSPSGRWEFRLKCPVSDLIGIRERRRDAIARAAVLNAHTQDKESTFAEVCQLWLDYQRNLESKV